MTQDQWTAMMRDRRYAWKAVPGGLIRLTLGGFWRAYTRPGLEHGPYFSEAVARIACTSTGRLPLCQ